MLLKDEMLAANSGVKSLKPYQPGKPIEELQRELGLSNIIKLASNENPLGPSRSALDNLEKALPEVNFYPDGSGYLLKQEIAKQRGVKEEQLILANGSDEIFTNVLRVFANQQDEVIVSEYGFAAYKIAARSFNHQVIEVKAKQWGHDLSAILASITEKTKVIFLANPNNPTGTYFKKQQFTSFINEVPQNIVVVLDQAYYEYMLGSDDYPDGVNFLASHTNLIVTHTFSKAYGLAGLRVGYAVCSAQIADLLNRVRLPFNVNSIALQAAKNALTDKEHLNKTIKCNSLGMQQYIQAFDDMKLTYIPSAGNFITVDLNQPAQQVYKSLLTKGVIVRTLEPYNMPNHLRISIGLTEQNKRCIEELKQILK